MTLEEAQARILELEEQAEESRMQIETLSQNNETLTADNEKLRTLNQRYFDKLTAQYLPEDDSSEEGREEVQSCEEFAKTLNI